MPPGRISHDAKSSGRISHDAQSSGRISHDALSGFLMMPESPGKILDAQSLA